jgi:MFS family permease
MAEQLSSFRIKRGRRVFNSYSAVNSFSFALVTGNTITLYAMSLGASSTAVGLLGAFMYLSFFAIPLGKGSVARIGLVKTFARNWMWRNWSLLPLLAIPFLHASGNDGIAVGILVLSVFLFNLFRGMGLIANNPVIGMLAPGKDRGEYIVRLSLINNGMALLATLFLAFLLHYREGVETYNLVVLIGIATGLAASSFLFKLPESSARAAASREEGSRALECARDAFRDPNFRKFVLCYFLIGLGLGMARPFIAVYCKEVYGQSDSVITVFTVASSLGALGMGAVMRLVIDRLGSKPMFIIFAAISLASLAPAVMSPQPAIAAFPFVFLALLSAATNMGFAGQESAAQTYFFLMVPKEKILDLSMVYYFILGGTGALGAVSGGAFLDALSAWGASPLASFRVFFLVSALLVALGIWRQQGLLDLGSYPVKDALAVLFSPRDMRALTLLRKLDSSEDPDEEADIIAELGSIASEVSADDVLDRLSSPRFAVRYEALQSVSSLTRLTSRVREALLRELTQGAYSTAALAARLLGQFRVPQALPALRSSWQARITGSRARRPSRSPVLATRAVSS